MRDKLQSQLILMRILMRQKFVIYVLLQVKLHFFKFFKRIKKQILQSFIFSQFIKISKFLRSINYLRMKHNNKRFTISILSLILLSLILSFSCCRRIEIPATTDKERVQIRIGRKVELREPGFDFSKIYKVEVFQTEDHEMNQFSACQENIAEVQFSVNAELYFENTPQQPLVIYKFNDVIHSQFLLDVFYDAQAKLIYLIFQNGKASIAKISFGDKPEDYIFEYAKVLSVQGLQEVSDVKQKVDLGYFSKVNGKVIFVNHQYAILFEDNSAKAIPGYERYKYFQSVISVEDRFLAVTDQKKGIAIYEPIVDDSGQWKMQKIKQIEPEDFQILNQDDEEGNTTIPELALLDIVYYKEQQSLIVLDQNSGIFSFELSIIDSNLTVTGMSQIVKKQLCELMYLYGNNLYAACDRIYEYYLGKWPTTEQKIIKHPNIKIREIFEEGDLVAFAGRNVFKLMYLDRYVNYFQDKRLDKLIFSNGIFISANENGLQFGSYNIIKPYISCQTFVDEDAGEHSLVFKTYAECNASYFQQNKVDFGNLEEQFTQNDVCVYTVYRDVYFWKKGQIKKFPMIVIFIILVIVVVGVLVVWFLKHTRIIRIQRELSELYSINQSGESAKYHVFGEEIEGKGYSEDKLSNQNNVKSSETGMKAEGVEDNKGTEGFEIQ